MPKVVPITFSSTVPASFGALPEPRVVTTRMAKPSAEDTLRALIKSDCLDDSATGLIETYPNLRKFVLKVSNFFTEYYPAQSNSYPNGIAEILDAAVMGFYRRNHANDPRDQIAAFLANGAMCATHVLLSHRVKQKADSHDVLWEPWTDGPLTDWMTWNAKEIRFEPAFAPPPEVRYATRQLLVPNLLAFNDVVSIARAGIDIKSLELF